MLRVSHHKGKRPNILYVDDNEDHLFLVKEKMEERGKKFQLFIEQNGKKVLERIKSIPFDLILLDYELESELNGLQILQLLRSKGIKCPVIMLTGQGDEKIAVEAIKSGAQEYFCKSSEDIDDLVHLIENVLLH